MRDKDYPMTTKYKFYTEADSAIRLIHVDLATEIGFNESVVLMQIDHLINVANNEKIHDGRYWTYDSVKNLKEKYFPFWGTTTIKKALSSLLKQKLIIKENYNKAGFDKTNWYTIDYEQVAKLKSILIGYKDKKGCVHPLVGMCPTIGQNPSNDESESDQPIPKSSSENSSEISFAKAKSEISGPNAENGVILIKTLNTSAEINSYPEKPNTNSFSENTNPKIPNTTSDTKKKTIFVAGKDEFDTDEMFALFAEQDAPTINRGAIRSKYKVDLSKEKFYEFLDAKKAGFNGDAESVRQYVEMEIKLWDHKNYPMADDKLAMKFEKEYWAGHPIALRFKDMTETQRESELRVQ